MLLYCFSVDSDKEDIIVGMALSGVSLFMNACLIISPQPGKVGVRVDVVP